MQSDTVARYALEAKQLGEGHATDAAAWSVNGNSDRTERASVLVMLREGDPAAFDYLPREPDLSGEYADGLTPNSLFEQITREAANNSNGDLVEHLADEYEAGVSETFAAACEAVLIRFCQAVAA
jgi:hypothetical protein